MITKKLLVLDVDDCILNTNETIIDMLNEKYNVSLDISMVKEWDYTTVLSHLPETVSKKDILSLMETEEFWNRVKVSNTLNNLLYSNNITDNYDIILLSAGTEVNLSYKKDKFASYPIRFIGTSFSISKEEVLSNMGCNFANIIQIDDNTSMFAKEVGVKVVITHNKDTDYNNGIADYRLATINEIFNVL